MFQAPGGDSEQRKAVFEKLFPEERFKNFSPVYIDIEADIDMVEVERADNRVEKELRSRRLHEPREIMAFVCAESVERVTEGILCQQLAM